MQIKQKWRQCKWKQKESSQKCQCVGCNQSRTASFMYCINTLRISAFIVLTFVNFFGICIQKQNGSVGGPHLTAQICPPVHHFNKTFRNMAVSLLLLSLNLWRMKTSGIAGPVMRGLWCQNLSGQWDERMTELQNTSTAILPISRTTYLLQNKTKKEYSNINCIITFYGIKASFLSGTHALLHSWKKWEWMEEVFHCQGCAASMRWSGKPGSTATALEEPDMEASMTFRACCHPGHLMPVTLTQAKLSTKDSY